MPWQWQRRGGIRNAPERPGLLSRANWQSSRAFQPATSLFFPCRDSLGNTLVPQVKKGDEVKAGSVLATLPDCESTHPPVASQSVRTNKNSPTNAALNRTKRHAADLVTGTPAGRPGLTCLFSPVAGKVVDITYRASWSGDLVPVIAIAPAAPAGEPELVEIPELPSAEASLQLAAAYAGLDLGLFQNVNQLVVNACDPDLGLYNRSCLLRERLADVASGATALASHVGGGNAYLAITRDQLTAAELESLKHDVAPLQILLVPDGYPAGRPETLVALVTGKKPSWCRAARNGSGWLPAASSPAVYCQDGVTVVGVERVAALGYALHEQRPPAEVMVSVDGDAISHPGVYRVPAGTPLAAFLEFAGLNRNSLHLLIRGGYLAGQAIPLDDAIVGFDDAGFLAFTSDRQQTSEAGVCLHCGRCLDVCPAGLSPTTIARLARKSLWGEAALAGADRCFGCGVCAYICPAGLPLVQLIQLAQLQLEHVK